MDYRHPITAAFTARSGITRPASWSAFERLLARRGRARIAVSAVIEQDGFAAARFGGDFVALGGKR
jgi:thioesterase domain-containing protein